MKNKFINLIATIVAILGLSTISMSTFAYDLCSDPEVTQSAKDAYGCTPAGEDALPDTIEKILEAVIGVGGLVAVVFIVIGGYGYMTSSGDAGKLKKAKDTILYACIGLAVCALAFAIVNWTIGVINPPATTP